MALSDVKTAWDAAVAALDSLDAAIAANLSGQAGTGVDNDGFTSEDNVDDAVLSTIRQLNAQATALLDPDITGQSYPAKSAYHRLQVIA